MKPNRLQGALEKNQGMQTVLDLTEELRDRHNVMSDSFLTSYELRQELLKRNVTMVGTV